MLPGYRVWATLFTGPHPNRSILTQVAKIQNFIFAKDGRVALYILHKVVMKIIVSISESSSLSLQSYMSMSLKFHLFWHESWHPQNSEQEIVAFEQLHAIFWHLLAKTNKWKTITYTFVYYKFTWSYQGTYRN